METTKYKILQFILCGEIVIGGLLSLHIFGMLLARIFGGV